MARYTTGEVAKLCGITVRTVQFYDSKNLLNPSELTDGGRRLYSEADVLRMRTICFLKELGFSLKDISKLLEESGAESTVTLLLDARESELQQQSQTCRQQIERLRELKSSLCRMKDASPQAIGAIAAAMEGNKSVKRVHVYMILVGIVMDILWIGGLVYAIISGNWWVFAVLLACAVVLGILISRYYYLSTAYICPEDHTVFRAPVRREFFAAHTPRTRKLTCPTCGFKGFCLETAAPKSEPKRIGEDVVW